MADGEGYSGIHDCVAAERYPTPLTRNHAVAVLDYPVRAEGSFIPRPSKVIGSGVERTAWAPLYAHAQD